jgi:hypothetical protein
MFRPDPPPASEDEARPVSLISIASRRLPNSDALSTEQARPWPGLIRVPRAGLTYSAVCGFGDGAVSIA